MSLCVYAPGNGRTASMHNCPTVSLHLMEYHFGASVARPWANVRERFDHIDSLHFIFKTNVIAEQWFRQRPINPNMQKMKLSLSNSSVHKSQDRNGIESNNEKRNSNYFTSRLTFWFSSQELRHFMNCTIRTHLTDANRWKSTKVIPEQ